MTNKLIATGFGSYVEERGYLHFKRNDEHVIMIENLSADIKGVKEKTNILREIIGKYANAYFYYLNVSYDKVRLQGKYMSEIVRGLIDSGYTYSLDTNGFLIFDKGDMEITLTD